MVLTKVQDRVYKNYLYDTALMETLIDSVLPIWAIHKPKYGVSLLRSVRTDTFSSFFKGVSRR